MKARPMMGMLVWAATLAQPGAAQTLWTSPHGPGMRGLSPATVAAQPALKWKLLLPQGTAHGGVTFSDGGKYLYFKTYGPQQGRVYKVAAATGRVLWTSPVQFGVLNLSGVTVDDTAGRLYTSGNQTSLVAHEPFVACVDRATGKPIWTTPVSKMTGVDARCGDGNVLLSPDRKRLYLHDGAGHVAALNASDGRCLWVHEAPHRAVYASFRLLQTLGPVWTDQTTGRTRLVVCGNAVADPVVCLQDDGASASVVWKANPAKNMVHRWWGHAVASADGSRLYVNGQDNFDDGGDPAMICLDAASGATIWAVGARGEIPTDLWPPACVGIDGTIYGAGCLKRSPEIGGIVAYRPDGTVKWTLDTKGGEVNGWPSVTAGGVLYAVDQCGTKKQPYLVAVRDMGGKGSLLWRVRLPHDYTRSETVVPGPDGTVYVSQVSETLRAIYLYAFAPASAVKVTRIASGVAPLPPTPPLGPLQIGPVAAPRSAPSPPAPRVTPVLMPQLGFSGVISAAYSPDGRYLAISAFDHSARLWDVSAGTELRRFEGHSDTVYSVAFSPDGRYLATGSWDKTARLWDVATGKELRRFGGHSEQVISVAFSPDGRYLATGDTIVRLWEVMTGKEVRRFEGHSNRVVSAFSPDGRYLATGCFDGTARLWDAGTGQVLRFFNGHSGSVRAVAFSPDGRYLATGSDDKTARLWDISSENQIRRFQGHSDQINCVAFSPDGRYLAAGSNDKTARLWDTSTGKEAQRLAGHSDWVRSVAFSHDGRSLATGSNDGTIRLWEVATGKQQRILKGRGARVISVAFSPDGRHLATNRGVWDATTAKELLRFKRPLNLDAFSDQIDTVAYSPDGKYLATGNSDKTARLWDAATGYEVRRFEGHIHQVWPVAFSPDGRYLATGSKDRTARIWEVSTGKETRRFEGHTGLVDSVAFSPDGRYLATGSWDNTARLWDTATGNEVLRVRHTNYVHHVAFSPDGRFLATGSEDMTARLWDVATGKELRGFLGHSGAISSVAFSPDGRILATCSIDGTARLWDVGTGKELHCFKGHLQEAWSMALSPDGRYLITSEYSGAAALWDTSSGKELCQLISFEDGAWAVVDPEGRYDASSEDVEGLVWVVGYETISLSQLKERYYEPGLLAKVLGFNKEPLRNVAAFKDVALPPTLEVIPPVKGSSTVTVKLAARSGGIGRVALSVNGSEFLSDARPVKLSPKASRATITVDLTYAATLKPGEMNAITAVAYTDTEPRIASRTASVSWKAPGTALSGKPRFYGLVAGVSDYAGTDLDLKYAGKDAVDVYTTLKMAADRLFLPENVDIRLLTTAGHPGALKPTKANLEKALVDFRKSRTGDTVFLYLAGHGITLRQGLDTYCYLTQEARSADGVLLDPAVRKQASVTSNELAEWLKKVPALKRVIVLDTCAAGSAGDVLTEKREVPGDQLRAMALLHGRAGTQVLMGCAADAVSYEATRFGQGLLTYAILDGVRGAALQNDQFVDVGTLFSYVSNAVPKLAGGLGGIQKPEFRSRGQAFAVGRMLAEDKVKVPIGAERPLVLRPVFQEQDTGDALRLAALVRDRIIELDWAGARGGTVGPGIAYVDADEMPGALRPRALYTVDGTNISVHLVIWQDDIKLRTEDINGTTDKVDDLVSRIVEAITSAWQPTGSAPKANTADR